MTQSRAHPEGNVMSTLKTCLNPSFIGQDLIAVLKATRSGPRFFRKSHRQFPVTVTYISDNGGHADAAKLEITKRLADINAILSGLSGQPAPATLYHDIPGQDWRAGAFDLAQAARDTVRGIGNIIFVNCAPRLKQRGLETNNKGEQVYCGMLRNGTLIAAVSEYSFALFRDLLESGDLELYPVNVQTQGSQFRSRDFFPWFTQILAFNGARLAKDWKAGLSVMERRAFLQKLAFIDTAKILGIGCIPDLAAEPCILRADCHGNLKLSLREHDIPEHWFGTPLSVRIGTRLHTITLRRNMFDTASGDIGLAPGSSGNWEDCTAGRFLEIALIGGDARKTFAISDQAIRDGIAVLIEGPSGILSFPDLAGFNVSRKAGNA
jgi:hypothetical protein